MATKKIDSSINAYWLLSILFSTIVLVGNILAIKTTSLFGLLTPAGMICFPITYALGDIITDTYGFAACRRVIITSLMMLLIFILLVNAATQLPNECSDNVCESFNAIFSVSLRLFLGTVAGYLTGELLNSKIMSILKFMLQGKVYITRSILSTSMGIAIDSTVFNIVAFAGTMSLGSLAHFALSQIILKFSFCVVLSIASKPIILAIRRIEKVDHYDNYRWFDKERTALRNE
jgi:uncharacterized integral membrane protein (TIGR00697 family)